MFILKFTTTLVLLFIVFIFGSNQPVANEKDSPSISTPDNHAVFDMHTHYKWSQASVTTPEQALAFMDAEAVSHAVVIGKPAEYALKLKRLAPKRIVAFMMGVWFLSSAFAFQIVGFIGKQLAIESTDKDVGGFETLTVYTEGFDLIAKYSIAAGVIVLLASPLIKKLMGKVH